MRCFLLLFLCLGLVSASALPPEAAQLIVSVAPDWDSTTGRLQCFERAGSGWKPIGGSWPVLYGGSGLAWGRGLHQNPKGARLKKEKDKRAPAGIFKVGKIYTYDQALPEGSRFPFHTVSEGDAWIDDPAHPQYNRHVRVDPANPPEWFAKQKMRHGDFAYRWLVEIRHNSDPPVAGDGSAIFFHLRRGATRPSAGCTVMAEPDLVRMIRWLRAEKNPHYVLLPKAEYLERYSAWGLPTPEIAASVLERP